MITHTATVGTVAAIVDPARALARQKAWATGLVALCALVYVVAKAVESRHPAIAYVAAFAEAAIIGALADWYAVVALFRHPFGLKLPHTAIIPANQQRIAESLGEFIAKHFLVGARVGEKVLEIDPATIAGRWLEADANRKLVAAHAARLLPQAMAAIDQEAMRGQLERGILSRLAAVDITQLVNTTLEVVTRNRRHHALLDEVLRWFDTLLAEPATRDAMRDRIRGELPTLFRFFQADAFLLQRLVNTTYALLQEVRADPAHGLRVEFDRFVADFLDKLKHSPEYGEKMQGLKHELLASLVGREGRSVKPPGVVGERAPHVGIEPVIAIERELLDLGPQGVPRVEGGSYPAHVRLPACLAL